VITAFAFWPALNLLDPRQREQLVIGDLDQSGDEAVDPQPPPAAIERRHRGGDGVDPPAARRDEPAQTRCVGEWLRDRASHAGDAVAVEQRDDAEADDSDEAAASEPTRAEALTRGRAKVVITRLQARPPVVYCSSSVPPLSRVH
jgi:hypothetical protein